MKKFSGIIAFLLLVTLVLSACGNHEGATNNQQKNTSSNEKNQENSPANTASTAKGKKVSSALLGLGFESMVMLNDTSKETASKHGLELQVFDANVDSNKQATQMQDIIATKPDAILLSPVDGNLIVPSVKAANKQNIPIFAVESKPLGGEFMTFVGYDDYKAGQMAADYIAKAVGEKGTVLEQRGMVGATSADKRSGGFNDGMKKYPNMKVVTLNNEWIADKAFTNTLDAFTVNKDIVASFSANDEMLRGVVSALEKLNKLKKGGEPGHIVLVANDGTPLGLQRIRQGIQDVTIDQHMDEMGRLAMERIAMYFRGETFPHETLLDPTIIDKNNVDDRNLWGNKKMQK